MVAFCLRVCLKAIGEHRLNGLLTRLLPEAEKRLGTFITYHQRPVSSSLVRTKGGTLRAYPKTAIVLQGPIIRDSMFTSETVRLYRGHFPADSIVLSTWEDESDEAARIAESNGIHVVLNRRPAYTGQSNINLQIISSRNGIAKAKELGAEYVLKTRTDQRFYAPDVPRFLHDMTEIFPVRGGNGTQKKRIVGVNLNTFLYRMYGLSDMLLYGHVEDMTRYWGVAQDDRVFSEEFVESRGKSLRIFANWRVCEVYLATEFLQGVGHALEWTLADSWKAFSNHFCIVDKEQLDLFWPKYNRLEYRSLNYEEFNTKSEMTFRDWINIYRDLESMAVPEHLLDRPL